MADTLSGVKRPRGVEGTPTQGALAWPSSVSSPLTAATHSAVASATHRFQDNLPANASTLSSSPGRIICFIDFDCYYVQCARLQNPALEGKPVGIVQKYLVVTCSYEARAKGVTKLMRTTTAMQKCPEMVLVMGEDLSWFKLTSDTVLEYLNTRMTQLRKAFRIVDVAAPVSASVERLGQEEFWMDLTDVLDCIQSCPDLGDTAPELVVGASTISAPGDGCPAKGGNSGVMRLLALCHSVLLPGAPPLPPLPSPLPVAGHSWTPPPSSSTATEGSSPDRQSSSNSPAPMAAAEGGPGARDDQPILSPPLSSPRSHTMIPAITGSDAQDVVDTAHQQFIAARFAAASYLALWLRQGIRFTFGLTCCAGVSTNKMAAKFAAGIHKPNNQCLLLPHHISAFMTGRAVGDIPGVGWQTGQTLEGLGITSVAQLRAVHPSILRAALEKRGPASGPRSHSGKGGVERGGEESGGQKGSFDTILACARGADPAPVVPTTAPATISDEDSFKSITDWSVACAKLDELLGAALVKTLVDAMGNRRRPRTLRLCVRHNRASEEPSHDMRGSAPSVPGGRPSKSVPIPAGGFPSAPGLASLAAAVPPYLLSRQLHFHHLIQARDRGAFEAEMEAGRAVVRDLSQPFFQTLRPLAITLLKDLLGLQHAANGAGRGITFNISLLSVAFTNFTASNADTGASSLAQCWGKTQNTSARPRAPTVAPVTPVPAATVIDLIEDDEQHEDSDGSGATQPEDAAGNDPTLPPPSTAPPASILTRAMDIIIVDDGAAAVKPSTRQGATSVVPRRANIAAFFGAAASTKTRP